MLKDSVGEGFLFHNSFPLIVSSSTFPWAAFVLYPDSSFLGNSAACHLPRHGFLQHPVDWDPSVFCWCDISAKYLVTTGPWLSISIKFWIQLWWEIEASSRLVASLFCLSPRGSGCSLYLPFLQSLKFSFSVNSFSLFYLTILCITFPLFKLLHDFCLLIRPRLIHKASSCIAHHKLSLWASFSFLTSPNQQVQFIHFLNTFLMPPPYYLYLSLFRSMLSYIGSFWISLNFLWTHLNQLHCH